MEILLHPLQVASSSYTFFRAAPAFLFLDPVFLVLPIPARRHDCYIYIFHACVFCAFVFWWILFELLCYVSPASGALLHECLCITCRWEKEDKVYGYTKVLGLQVKVFWILSFLLQVLGVPCSFSNCTQRPISFLRHRFVSLKQLSLNRITLDIRTRDKTSRTFKSFRSTKALCCFIVCFFESPIN